MKLAFYDVKTRKKVETDITGKQEYTNEKTGTVRYAVKGKTEDGRPLTQFVSKAKYDEIQV